MTRKKKQARETIDLGLGHSMSWLQYKPDDLPANRKAHGGKLPRLERAGCTVYHKTKEGKDCSGSLSFDLPEMRTAGVPEGHLWQVQSWDPLTITPSILCKSCGDHGYITNGRWVPA
jgi:hypothetical protein